MRLIWAAMLGLVVLVPAPAGATYRQAPWCAVYRGAVDDTRWDCIYPTLESCVPFILGGTRGFCNPNPRYRAPEPPRHRRRH